MSLFPISADKVQLSTDAPVATDSYVGGLLRDAGNTVCRAALSGGVQWLNGLLMTALGQVVYVDATAGLPAGTQFVNGIPLAPSGAMCCSTDAAVNYSNGLPRVLNGAIAATGADLSAQVAALFASLGSTPKLWLDPSDRATLWQDSAGTTPVVAAGDPIGRILDKSGANNHASQVTTTSRPLWQTSNAGFDGVDDGWSIAAINFTTTDKITVVSGVYKASDSTAQRIWGLSASPPSTNGSLELLAVYGSGLPQAGVGSRGITQRAVVPVAAPAPGAYVATGVGDIAAPLVVVRSNGVSAQSSAAQGGGTYGNHPSFVGSVGGTTSFLNGNLYGLMVIGRLLTADELSLCERYMAQKSGVTL